MKKRKITNNIRNTELDLNMKEVFIIKGQTFKPYINYDKIEATVHKMASEIAREYNNKNLLFLIILKGAIVFASDLIRRIPFNCSFDVIRASSYGSGMESSGKVDIQSGDLNHIKGKDIIILEDIIDTGLTIKELIEKLKEYQPNSIEVAALLSKTEKRKVEVNVKYLGIEIPDLFVVGYGLDYDEHGRNLPEIYALSE